MRATLVTILARKFPGVPYRSKGDDFATLERLDGGEVPALEVIESFRAEVETAITAERAAYDAALAYKEGLPGRLMAIFETLDEDTQAKWYESGVKAGMKDALLEGKVMIAKKVLERAVATTSEEADVKAQMLALLP